MAATLTGVPIDFNQFLATVPEASDAIPAQNGLIVDSEGAFRKSEILEINAYDRGVRSSNSRAENSARMQDVIDEIMDATYGGVAVLPKGKFDLDPASQIQIPKVLGKHVELRGAGRATVIDVGSSATDAAIYAGSDSSSGAIGLHIRDLMFRGGSSSLGRAIETEWANGFRMSNVGFSDMLNAILMETTYAAEFVDCLFQNVGGANIYSSTHCHHLALIRPKAYNAGVGASGQFLHIDDLSVNFTDNLIIRDGVFEGCRQILRADDGLTGSLFEGNYVEYCVTDPMNFGAGAHGFSWRGGWLALGAAFTFHDWHGGEFSGVAIHNQSIAFDADCTDVHTPNLRVTGTSTLSTSAMMHSMSSLLNSATANGTYPPKYSKSDGIVQLHGQIDNCPGGGAPVFQLPADYRPLQSGTWPTVAGDNLTFRSIVIDASNGMIVPSAPAAGTIKLDGICFRRGQ